MFRTDSEAVKHLVLVSHTCYVDNIFHEGSCQLGLEIARAILRKVIGIKKYIVSIPNK
jgi:hypothetical protein